MNKVYNFDALIEKWPLISQMQSNLADRGRRMDAADVSFFFTRQLTYIYTKTYDIKYAELMARKCFPINREVHPGAEFFIYRQYDQVGMGKIVNVYSKDFPRVDVRAKEFTGRVKEIGESFGYNWKELQSAIFTGQPLEQRRANSAKRASFQKENDIIWFGDTDNNLIGLFNNTNIPISTPTANGNGGSTNFKSKTSAQIIADMSQPFIDIRKNSLNVEVADTLLMSVAAYGYIAMTPYSQYSDKTILQWFLANTLDCKEVVPINELGSVTAGVINNEDVMVAYKRDADHIEMIVPQEFFMAPPQMEGFEWTISCLASTGGLVTYYPLSIEIVHGI